MSDDDSDLEEIVIPNVKTFVRSTAPQELAPASSQNHRRGVSLELVLLAHTYNGGSIVRGNIVLQYRPNAKRNRATQVCSIRLDCLGTETVKGGEQKSKIFFTLAQDILTTSIYLHDLSKTFLQQEHIKSGDVHVPFELQLPLDVGPGSFECKEAEISYSLTASIELVNGKRFPYGKHLRVARKLRLFPCLDPQKALIPTPAPIDTLDEGKLRFGGKGTLKIAARIHRPSWIAGQIAYIDVSATNDSKRDVHKIELELTRSIVFFKHAAASSAFHAIDQRIPDKIVAKRVSSNSISAKNSKSGDGWTGIKSNTRETVVCHIAVPADELTIQAVECKYFIRISVCTKGGKVDLELPITIVHINSLDVIPSSVPAVTKMISMYAPAIDSQRRQSRRSSLASNLGANLVSVEEDPEPEPLNLANFHNSPRRASHHSRRSLSTIDVSGSPNNNNAITKPGIQCDLRRALSLDYQSRSSKLDISTAKAGYTTGAPIAPRSPDRRRRDLSENLAHRLHRERTKNINFYDVI